MNKSVLIAGVAVAALVLWMLSGQFGSQDSAGTATAAPPEASGKRAKTAMKVQTRRQSAEAITREIVVQGQVEPLKVMHLRSEAGGTIEQLPVSKGQRIASGEVIAVLSAGNREANLAVARANLQQAENEYAAARKLQRQGLQSATALDTAAAQLEAAKAQVVAAELDISDTTLKAPFDALIDDVTVEVGDFIDRGGAIATLVDNSQLLITGNVPQKNILDVTVDANASATLITGETLNGTVRYISSMADAATRSFKIEVIIDQPPARAMSGVSAVINIPVERLKAHFISPAILALDSDGTLGIKAVSEDNKVMFHPVEVVKTESDGAWVTGIPDEVNLITLGQGFVSAGESVQPVPEPAESDS
jgi:multidrug efflux system membrane fusion protein